LFGSILLGFYFTSVGFAPYFKVSEFPFIVIAIFTIASLMFFFLVFLFFTPIYFLKYGIESLEKEIGINVNLVDKIGDYKRFHFGPPVIFFLLVIFCLLLQIIFEGIFSDIIVVMVCVLVILLIICLYIFYLVKKIVNEGKNGQQHSSKKYFFVNLIFPILYYGISLWLIFVVFYRIVAFSSVPALLGFALIYALFGSFSFLWFNSSGKQLIFFSIVFLFISLIFILFFFGKANILYLKPIQLLKLGQVEVELCLKQNDKDGKSKECKGDQKSICGTLLFRDSNFYYIESKSCNRKERNCNRKESNKAKSNNQIQQEKVVESSNQAESDNQTKPKNVGKIIIKKVPSAEVDRVIFYNKIDKIGEERNQFQFLKNLFEKICKFIQKS